MKYRPEIDGLRAIAISSVVLFHACGDYFPGGFIGVDIFFVISGYLITSIILQEHDAGTFSFWNFYARRARRILPALFFMLLVVTGLCWLVLFPQPLVEAGKAVIYTVLFIANFRLAGAAGYFDAWNQDHPLLHTWSLAVEEQFYFIWPVLLLLLVTFVPRQRQALFIFAGLVLSLVCSQILSEIWPRSAFYHLPSRAWELLAGALLAFRFTPEITNKRVALALSLVGLVLIFVPAFFYYKEMQFPGLSAVPPVLGAVLLIYGESGVRTSVGAILSWKPVVFIGLISYSLYLWHWPAIALPQAVFARELTTVETLIAVTTALALSIFSYFCIETPFRRRPASKIASSQPISPSYRRWPIYPAILGVASAVVLCVGGGFFQKQNGAPWRFAAEVQPLLPVSNKQAWKKTCSSPVKILQGVQYCHIGLATDDDIGDFVLWGDSHSENYIHELSKIYRSGTLFIHPGCQPVLGATYLATNETVLALHCREMKIAVMNEIARRKPRTVMIVARWTYFDKTPYGLERRASGRFVADDMPKGSGQMSVREVFLRQLTRTVTEITATGAKVVLLAQAPEIKQNPRNCAAIFRNFGLSDQRCSSIKREQVEKRQERVNEVLQTVATQNLNVKVFWPIPHMCDAKDCFAIRNGEVLYEDGDHLALGGSKALLEPLRAFLAPASQSAAAVRSPSGGDANEPQSLTER